LIIIKYLFLPYIILPCWES